MTDYPGDEADRVYERMIARRRQSRVVIAPQPPVPIRVVAPAPAPAPAPAMMVSIPSTGTERLLPIVSDPLIKKDPLRLIPKDMYEPRKQTTREDVEMAIRAMQGIGRGQYNDQYNADYEAIASGNPPNVRSLAEMFARRVAGKHNKNVLAIITGDLGSGKSMLALELAYGASVWLSTLKGGRPEDYFSLENVSVIDPEMLQEKLANLAKYNIYILDDAGPGYDSRSFMSNDNKDINYTLQTCRTSNNIILLSAPHTQMLDVTIRRLAQYLITIIGSHHDQGVTIAQVFNIIRDVRQNKLFYKYNTKKNLVISRYISLLPPKTMKEDYDVIRTEQAGIIAQRRTERQAKEAAKREKKPAGKWTVEEFGSLMAGYVTSGKDTTIQEIADDLSASIGAVKTHMKKNGFSLQRDAKTRRGVVVNSL